MVREPKRGRRGRGRKETLADKPLDTNRFSLGKSLGTKLYLTFHA